MNIRNNLALMTAFKVVWLGDLLRHATVDEGMVFYGYWNGISRWGDFRDPSAHDPIDNSDKKYDYITFEEGFEIAKQSGCYNDQGKANYLMDA
jgi:hypothetical protein